MTMNCGPTCDGWHPVLFAVIDTRYAYDADNQRRFRSVQDVYNPLTTESRRPPSVNAQRAL